MPTTILPDHRAASAPARPFAVAVPRLSTYPAASGIGRVLHSLRLHWGERVALLEASYVATPLPLLRNLPHGVAGPAADLLLIPQLTGAQALRGARGLPGVVIVHDVGVVDFAGDRAGVDWFGHQLVRRSFYGLRHATRVVTVSNFSRERLLAHLPDLAERVSVVPNGVGPVFLNYRRTQAEARARVERALGRPLGTPLLLNVGTELPRKNLPLLLEALVRLRADHPRAQLLKVGGPGHPRWREQTLAAARRLGLANDQALRFVSVEDDEQLADLYRAADVYVSPSLYEGFGLPALEALAVGAQVVVTDRGALPEVVGAIGRIVPPQAEALARAVAAALADEGRHGRSLAGRERAASFTWAAAAAKYLALMSQLGEASYVSAEQ